MREELGQADQIIKDIEQARPSRAEPSGEIHPVEARPSNQATRDDHWFHDPHPHTRSGQESRELGAQRPECPGLNLDEDAVARNRIDPIPSEGHLDPSPSSRAISFL